MKLFDRYADELPDGTILILATKVLAGIEAAPPFFYFKDHSDFCIAPPFNNFCVEAKSESTGLHWLIFATVMDDREKLVPPPHIDEEEVWRCVSFQFLIRYNGQDMKLTLYSTVWLDKVGKILAHEKDAIYCYKMKTTTPDARAKRDAEAAVQMTTFALFVMSLMSSTGQVMIADEEVSRREKRKNVHALRKRHNYKVLKIRPKKGQHMLARLLQGLPPETDRQQHYVRGHFKHMNNLFGRYKGVWYWQPHQRGSATEGKLDKSYEVELE